MPRLIFAFVVLFLGSVALGQSCPALWVRSQTDLGLGINRIAVLDGVAFAIAPSGSISLDVSDPSAPKVVSTGPALPVSGADFALLPSHIVVAGDGIGILDPNHPEQLIPTKVYGQGAFNRVATDGNRVYAAQSPPSSGLLYILDFTNPTQPELLAVHTATSGVYFSHMATVGPNMLAVAYGGLWPDVVVFDLTDPKVLSNAATVLLSSLSVYVGEVTAASGRLYVATDLYDKREFQEFNVMNPLLPKKLTTLYTGKNGDFSIIASPNFVALTHPGAGFQINLDVFSRQLGPSKPVGTVKLNSNSMSVVQPKAMEGDRIFVVHNGVLTIVDPTPCYANCDCSTALDIDDFICFQTRFAFGDPSGGADCDADGSLTIDDFVCFQAAYAAGC